MLHLPVGLQGRGGQPAARGHSLTIRMLRHHFENLQCVRTTKGVTVMRHGNVRYVTVGWEP